MKRLLFILLAALSALFCVQAAYAQDLSRHKVAEAARKGDNNKQHTATWPRHMDPYIEAGTTYTSEWMTGKPCDANGNFVSIPEGGLCKVFNSPSMTYRIRQSSKYGDSIFVMQNSSPELFVKFAVTTNRVESQSPRAEQFALAHGYRLDRESGYMVASNGNAPTPTRTINCKAQLNINDRLACAKENNSSGTMTATAPPQAPAPTVAQAPQPTTCTGNAIQRNLCLAAAALAAANADKTTGVGVGVRP